MTKLLLMYVALLLVAVPTLCAEAPKPGEVTVTQEYVVDGKVTYKVSVPDFTIEAKDKDTEKGRKKEMLKALTAWALKALEGIEKADNQEARVSERAVEAPAPVVVERTRYCKVFEDGVVIICHPTTSSP